jgi:hypothetical protein
MANPSDPLRDPLRAYGPPPPRRPVLRILSPKYRYPICGYVVSPYAYPFYTHWDARLGKRGRRVICTLGTGECAYCPTHERRWLAALELRLANVSMRYGILVSAGAAEWDTAGHFGADPVAVRGRWCLYSRETGTPQGSLKIALSVPAKGAPELPHPLDLALWVRQLYGYAPDQGGQP